MDFILMEHGFPPAIVKAEITQRLTYYEALKTESIAGDLQPFNQIEIPQYKENIFLWKT